MTNAPTILLAEDDFLAAQGMVRLLRDLGVNSVGPVATAQEGLELAAKHRLDGAVLDINLRGGSSAKLADHLHEQQCPFLFVTGYRTANVLPPHLQVYTRLIKPIDAGALAQALESMLGVTLTQAQ